MESSLLENHSWTSKKKWSTFAFDNSVVPLNSAGLLAGSSLCSIQNCPCSVSFWVHAWSRCGGMNKVLIIWIH